MSGAGERLAAAIDRLSIATGHLVSWLTLFMVIVTFVIVVLRYLLDSGFIWLQEGLTWMHAAVFMLGAAYTLQRDESNHGFLRRIAARNGYHLLAQEGKIDFVKPQYSELSSLSNEFESKERKFFGPMISPENITMENQVDIQDESNVKKNAS